jgi:hypothetical protein
VNVPVSVKLLKVVLLVVRRSWFCAAIRPHATEFGDIPNTVISLNVAALNVTLLVVETPCIAATYPHCCIVGVAPATVRATKVGLALVETDWFMAPRYPN